jgi:phosphatidylserine/phosphatidylglycerophosphate/cardiolipin synthase-like enzyme
MALESTATRRAAVSLILDSAHYERVTLAIARAKVSVWISTANVKQLLVQAPIGTRDRARGRYVPIADTFQSLVDRGVQVRLLHAAVPSRPFREELARRATRLVRPGFEMRACPRVHLKMIAIDGALLYLGSANLTGAGLGAKSDGRRNFEMGLLTDDEWLLDQAQARFDRIWRGLECGACRMRAKCPGPIDVVYGGAAPPAVARPAARSKRQRIRESRPAKSRPARLRKSED